MSQDIFYSINGCETLEEGLRADNVIIFKPLPKLELYIRMAFPFTNFLHIIKKPSELGCHNPIFAVQICTQMRFWVYSSFDASNTFYSTIRRHPLLLSESAWLFGILFPMLCIVSKNGHIIHDERKSNV